MRMVLTNTLIALKTCQVARLDANDKLIDLTPIQIKDAIKAIENVLQRIKDTEDIKYCKHGRALVEPCADCLL